MEVISYDSGPKWCMLYGKWHAPPCSEGAAPKKSLSELLSSQYPNTSTAGLSETKTNRFDGLEAE
jgi:hypothetical protein